VDWALTAALALVVCVGEVVPDAVAAGTTVATALLLPLQAASEAAARVRPTALRIRRLLVRRLVPS